MKMKSKLFYAPMVIIVMAALANVMSATPKTPWTRWTTPGPYGVNLNGKMFTLSFNRGGISFYPPYFSPSSPPWPSTTPYPTRRYITRPYFTTTTIPTTTTTTTTPRTTTTTTTPRTTTPTTTPRTTTTTPRTTTTTPRTTTTTTTPRTTTTTPRTTTTTTTPRTTTNTPRTTTTTTYPPWTSAPPTRGVSVCLRYLTDYQQQRNPTIFTLSPSGNAPLKLAVSDPGHYRLTFDRYSYYRLYLQPDLWFWSNIGPDIWTRVCITVDSMKNVAQVFSGSSISIRKMLPLRYVWSGEPVLDFSGFDGQVTDVQMWDYPLLYREIFNYMANGVYGPYRGSVLTWSSISYSPRGNTLLEDAYEWQAKKSISSNVRRRRPKGENKTREFFNVGESKERKRQQL